MPAAANRLKPHDDLKIVRPGGKAQRAEFRGYEGRGQIRIWNYPLGKVQIIPRHWATKARWIPAPKQRELF